MADAQSVIDVLLSARPAGFRNKHLAEALGVSRARASQLLASRVLFGELTRTSKGCKYVRGTDWDGGSRVRGATRLSFWTALVEDCPKVAYVAFRGLALAQLRTRRQIKTALSGLAPGRHFLIVDFEGVRYISESASRELFLKVPRREGAWVEPINLEPAVARTIRRVVRAEE